MITREDLYSLVWRMPVQHAAELLGVSNIYLARVCVALDVPRPSLGWWRKHQVGTATPPPPLPPLRPGVLCRWEKGESISGSRASRYRHIPAIAGSKRHPLVERASTIFHAKESSTATAYLAPRRLDAIDLICTVDTLDRILALADTLFKTLEKRGHPVVVANSGCGLTRPSIENLNKTAKHTLSSQFRSSIPRFPTVAIIASVPVGLALVETSEEVLMRYIGHGRFERASTASKVYGISWTEWQRCPNGRLAVVAYSPHFSVPWKRRWVVIGGKLSSKAAEALVIELEETAPNLSRSCREPFKSSTD